MRYLIVFIFAIVLAGCGKEKIPPPPTAHALLVKKLFKNLARKEHKEAIKRIQKVHALDPSNDFLIQLEEREFCNYYIKQAQKQIDANKLSQAMSTIDTARKKYALNRNLLAAQEELMLLQELQRHIKLLNSAVSSQEMNLQINAISQLLKKHPDGKILLPVLRKKMVNAFRQNLYEQKRARFDLLCDLKTVRSAEHPDQSLNNALTAVLAVANAAATEIKD